LLVGLPFEIHFVNDSGSFFYDLFFRLNTFRYNPQ